MSIWPTVYIPNNAMVARHGRKIAAGHFKNGARDEARCLAWIRLAKAANYSSSKHGSFVEYYNHERYTRSEKPHARRRLLRKGTNDQNEKGVAQ